MIYLIISTYFNVYFFKKNKSNNTKESDTFIFSDKWRLSVLDLMDRMDKWDKRNKFVKIEKPYKVENKIALLKQKIHIFYKKIKYYAKQKRRI